MYMKCSDIDTYLHKVTPRRDVVLQEMERYASRKGFPIIGPLVGRFLYQMARSIKARRVLELGSGFGYSAYWFSQALGKTGRIIMTDSETENRDRALRYFEKGKIETQIIFHVGDALETVRSMRGSFDIILNDIDKESYPETIELAANRLRSGGLFITDNAIWSGKVLKSTPPDNATRQIKRFTRMLYEDDRFFTTILPLRDGIALAVRN